MCTDHHSLIGDASKNHLTRLHHSTRSSLSLPSPSIFAICHHRLRFPRHLHRQHVQQRARHTYFRKMSSPSQRRQRDSQSATPRRSARQSQSDTPQNQSSQLASSPLFFQSSPSPNDGAGHDANSQVSSPLRQMSNSQSTQDRRGTAATPSSPLLQMSESQETGEDGQRTPRASGMIGGKPFG